MSDPPHGIEEEGKAYFEGDDAGDNFLTEGKLLEKGGFVRRTGTDVAGLFELETGDYVAACFIPEGSTGDEEGTGPPHFTKGMKTEFTVS